MKKYITLMLVVICSFAHAQDAIDLSKVNDGFDRLADNYGGAIEFKRLFEQEIVYPEKALADKTSGTVELRFIVMSDGTTRDLKVLKSVSPEIDAEAIRIFRMLLWKPAIYRGDAVNVYFVQKFDFNLSKYKKICKKRGYTAVPYAYQSPDTGFVIEPKPDQVPVYPEGNFALQALIGKNLQYPQAAVVQNLQGTVQLSFIVEPSGMMSNIMVEKGVGGGCNEEAIRVLKLIKWQPGTKDGKAVRVRMTLPVVFSLSNGFHDNSHSEQGR